MGKGIERVGVIGLGFMGGAIAAHIARAGFAVAGFDIDPARGAWLAASGGQAAASCREVAQRSELVITSLPGAAALEEVVHGESGLLSSGRSGLVVLEMSTLALSDKRKAEQALRAAGIVLLDCPISGGTRATEKDLVVYGSGPGDAYGRCLPVIESFSRGNYHLGEFGNGTRMKLLANLLVAIHNVSSAEAMVLGIKAGLDPQQILEVIGNSAGRSRMLEIRGPRMARDDYENPSMTVRLFRKDLEIIRQFAEELACPTPLLAASSQVYRSAVALGFAERDTASVCAVLEAWAGLRRKPPAPPAGEDPPGAPGDPRPERRTETPAVDDPKGDSA